MKTSAKFTNWTEMKWYNTLTAKKNAVGFRSSFSGAQSAASLTDSGFFVASMDSDFGGACGTPQGVPFLRRSSNPHVLPPTFRSVGDRFTTCFSGVSMTNAITATQPTLAVIDGKATTTSNDIATTFGKDHAKVLRDIRALVEQCDEKFSEANFGLAEYLDEQGKMRPSYTITRDGFTLLAMGFTGKKALAFKLSYITAFNAMEAALHPATALPSRLSTKEDRRALNDAVRELPQVSALTFSQAWKIVHQFLKIDSIEKATVDQIDSALQYVHTLRVQGFEASTLVKQIEAPSGSIAALTNQVNKGNGYPDELLMPLYAQLIVRFAPRHMLISKDRYADLFKDAIRIKEVGEKLISRVNMLGMMDCDINDNDWSRQAIGVSA